MKFARLFILAVALVAGGIAAYLAVSMTGTDVSVVEITREVELDTDDVLVAASDLRPGEPITSSNVEWKAWPEGSADPALYQRDRTPTAIDDLSGTIVRSQFFDGEPIRAGKLVRAESGFMSAILESGKRATAVSISAESTAGGFILPNDRVDVILTIRSEDADPSSAFGGNLSRTLLQNVRVLAIDQSVEEKDNERVVVGSTATLELDPVQVEVLAAAEAGGRISLALRSMADASEDTLLGVRTTSTVRIIRFGRSQTVSTQ